MKIIFEIGDEINIYDEGEEEVTPEMEAKMTASMFWGAAMRIHHFFSSDEQLAMKVWNKYTELGEMRLRALYLEQNRKDRPSGCCDCYRIEFGRPVCYGTREKESCECGGCEENCDFYEKRRVKASGR